MKMWFLVVFIMGADGVTPEVTGQTFASPTECLSAGMSAKVRDPKRVRAWDCSPIVNMEEVEEEPPK